MIRGWIVALALLLLAGTLQAGNPYLRRPTGPLRWDTSGAVVWNPDSGALGNWSNNTARGEVEDAFDVWEVVPTSTIQFVQGPRIVDGGGSTIDVGPSNFGLVLSLDNGQNPIIFDNDREIFNLIGQPPSTLGFSSPLTWEPDGTLTKAFVILEGDWFDGENGDAGELSVDAFRAMIVHEAGHFGGLGHSTVNKELQGVGLPGCPGPSASQIETMHPINAAEARTLFNDDVMAISSLYPTAAFLADHATLQGQLVDRDGLSGFNGANIVLRPDGTCSERYDQAQAMQSGVNPFESGGDGGYAFRGLAPSSGYTIQATSIGGTGGYPVGGTEPPSIGADDYYNGAAESAFDPPDDPALVGTVQSGAAGSTTTGIDILLNVAGDPGTVAASGPDALFVEHVDGTSSLPGRSLALDDGDSEGAPGIDGPLRVAWLNRFTPTAGQLAFRLETIDLLFSSPTVSPGRAIRLLVYVDPSGSGDPANATLAYSQNVAIQSVSNTFDTYVLASPVLVSAGDVYVGAWDLVADVQPTAIADADGNTLSGRAFLQIEGIDPAGFEPTYEQGLGDLAWMVRIGGTTLPPPGIRLTWGEACNAGTLPRQGYAVYEGTLDSLAGVPDHMPIVCGTDAGERVLQLPLGAGDRFWLVAPLLADREGSPGSGSGGAPRVPAASCATIVADACP